MINSIKLNKKIIAVFMTVIMALGIFNLTALAEAIGTISVEITGARGDVDIKYRYNDIGNSYVYASGENSTFTTIGDAAYTVEFSPALGASAYVVIYNKATNEEIIRILVPTSSPGMPATLRTYVSIPEGYYSVKIMSRSDTATSGTLSILGVFDTTNAIVG